MVVSGRVSGRQRVHDSIRCAELLLGLVALVLNQRFLGRFVRTTAILLGFADCSDWSGVGLDFVTSLGL